MIEQEKQALCECFKILPKGYAIRLSKINTLQVIAWSYDRPAHIVVSENTFLELSHQIRLLLSEDNSSLLDDK